MTPWNRRKNNWQTYAVGHYTRKAEQAPSWRGGVSNAPYTFDWPEIADRIRERDGHRCQDCGRHHPGDRRKLHVHHIDEDPTNNAPDNLVSLCRGCHSRRHPIAERLRQGRSPTPTR